jgi:hypothetical protein
MKIVLDILIYRRKIGLKIETRPHETIGLE